MNKTTDHDQPIRVGILGLGFMGRVHLHAYRAANQTGYHCPIVAVCDGDPDRLTGQTATAGNLGNSTDDEPLFDPNVVRTTTNVADFLADPKIDLISICTHTDTHVDLAIAALEAGKHVLVEKPLAVSPDDAQRVADAAEKAHTLCMPAHCMRFWPGWTWLKERINEGTFGPVKSASFQRLGSPPAWAPEFYRNPDRSGGALVDLHIHDADFIRWCFGDATSVSSTGTLNHVTTQYHYPDGPASVVAEGGWIETPGFTFQMRFVVEFEKATADFDLARHPPLLLSQNGETSAIDLEEGAGYDHEIRHLLNAIRSDSPSLRVTPADAVAVATLLAAERRSLETGSIQPVE